MVERLWENLKLRNAKSRTHSRAILALGFEASFIAFLYVLVGNLSVAAAGATGGLIIAGFVDTWALLKIVEGLRMYSNDFKHYLPPDRNYGIYRTKDKQRKRTISEMLTDAIHFKFKS